MPIANTINRRIYNPNGHVQLPGMVFKSAFQANAINGQTDLYTCPANKRALIYKNYGFNGSGGTITVTTQFKVSGVYYPMTFPGGVGTLTQYNTSNPPIVLEAGESFSFLTTASGMNMGAIVVEFDNNGPVKTAKLLTLASGNNTIYTCPANTNAWILDGCLQIRAAQNSAHLNYYNGSGGAITRSWYNVPNAGSPGTTNLLVTGSASTGFVNSSIVYTHLTPGDSIVLNVSAATATQAAWINVMEVPV